MKDTEMRVRKIPGIQLPALSIMVKLLELRHCVLN